MDISKLLTFSAKEGASDCRISAGEPPSLRDPKRPVAVTPKQDEATVR